MQRDDEKLGYYLAGRQAAGQAAMFGIIWCLIDALIGLGLVWVSKKCSEDWGLAVSIAGYVCFALALFSLVYGFRKSFKIAKTANWAIQNPEKFEKFQQALDEAERRRGTPRSP